MPEKRVISTPILLSITTGKLLCEASDYHAACEFVLGHQIMVHQFTDDALQDKLCAEVLKQHPDLTADLADDVTPENVWEKVDVLVERFGAERAVVQGNHVPELGVLDGIPEGKEVILVETYKERQN